MINDNMSNQELLEYFNNIGKPKYRNITDSWNSLSIDKRKDFSAFLKTQPSNKSNKNALEDITSILRKQAVDDFWTHERELVLQ